jgi:hypothetical protein
MACGGYEHGERVVLVRALPSIPSGSEGNIVGINSNTHTIDIDFDYYGVIANIDAKRVKPISTGSPTSIATA